MNTGYSAKYFIPVNGPSDTLSKLRVYHPAKTPAAPPEIPLFC